MVVLPVRLGVGERRLLRLGLDEPVDSNLRGGPALRVPHPAGDDPRAGQRLDPELGVHRVPGVALVGVHDQGHGVRRHGVDLEVQVVIGGPPCVSDQRDHVPGLHPLPHRREQPAVVVVGRAQDQSSHLAIVADRDGVRPLLGGPGEHDDAVPDGVHRGPIGVVELDALVLLEVAAHRRAVAVGLVDVGLVAEGDGAPEPGVAHPLEVRVRRLLIGDADEGESLVIAARGEPGRAPCGVPAA